MLPYCRGEILLTPYFCDTFWEVGGVLKPPLAVPRTIPGG